MDAVFSVVIPSFNRAPLLVKAIESIEKQTFKDWECIVVDDGSTDNTAEAVRRCRSRDARIKYFRIEHGGVSVARNKGIVNSSGKAICFLDSDDVYRPYTLDCFAKAFKKYPDHTFAYGSLKDEPTVKSCDQNIAFQLTDVYPTLVYGNQISAVLAMKYEKNRCPLFKEDLLTAEDYQFALDLARSGMGIRIDNKLFEYHFDTQNKSTRYIADGTYIEAAITIAQRELTELKNCPRSDAASLCMLWDKRLQALRVLSAAFHNDVRQMNDLIKNTPAIEYNLWLDLRYVLYRLAKFAQRFRVAENLVYFFSRATHYRGASDTDKILASILDAIFCGIHMLPTHVKITKTVRAFMLRPNLNSLKQSLRVLL